MAWRYVLALAFPPVQPAMPRKVARHHRQHSESHRVWNGTRMTSTRSRHILELKLCSFLPARRSLFLELRTRNGPDRHSGSARLLASIGLSHARSQLVPKSILAGNRCRAQYRTTRVEQRTIHRPRVSISRRMALHTSSFTSNSHSMIEHSPPSGGLFIFIPVFP